MCTHKKLHLHMTFRYIHVFPQTLNLFTTTKEKSHCNFAGFVEQVDDAVLIRIQRSSVHGLSNRLQHCKGTCIAMLVLCQICKARGKCKSHAKRQGQWPKNYQWGKESIAIFKVHLEAMVAMHYGAAVKWSQKSPTLTNYFSVDADPKIPKFCT